MKKYHYVYRITNKITGKHYYGGRSSKRSPSEDLGHFYFSSYTNKYFKIDQKQNPSHYKYKVIKEFSTRKEANEFEIFLHKKFDVKNHPKFINKANQTSSKFDTTGKSFNTNKLTVLDIRDGNTKQVNKSEYHEYSYYVSLSKNKIAVLDTRDNLTKQISLNEYNSCNYYIAIASKKIAAIDIRDNNIKHISVEDYNKYDYYKTVSTGKVVVLDTRDNTTKMVSVEDYNTQDYYKVLANGQISVIDIRDNSTKRVSVEEYKKYTYYKSIFSGKLSVIDTRDNQVNIFLLMNIKSLIIMYQQHLIL